MGTCEKLLNREDFCDLVKCSSESWIFRGENTEKAIHYKSNERIYYNNGVDTIWQFIYRPELNEIWYSHAGLGPGDCWTDWETWCKNV